MNTMLMLVRREFWEHRSLWIAPLAVAAVLLVATIFSNAHTSGGVRITVGDNATAEQVEGLEEKERDVLKMLGEMPAEKKKSIYAVVMWSFATVQGVVLMVVLFFYLLDSLYAERKDRSILFWKSLPVSDNQTVASKLLVGLALTPLFAIAVTAVVQLLFAGIWTFRFGDSVIGGIFPAFDARVWLSIQWVTLVTAFVAALWYAPIAAYLLLVSAWARKNPFLWAVLPPIVVVMVEELLFDTNTIAAFIAHRFVGFVEKFDLSSRFGDADQAAEIPGAIPQVGSVFEGFDVSQVFVSPHLWLGLVAAALMLFGASRLRRYRDDT
jgi:ABC-2 type transport system permease protein